MNSENQLLKTLLEEKVRFTSYIRKFFNKDDSFDDIYQDICVKILDKNISPDNVRAYLYRCAYNQIIDTFLKKKRYKQKRNQYFLYKKIFLQESKKQPIEFSRNVFAYARKNLEARYYYPIKLKYQQGLNSNEIAEALHLKSTTVSSYLSIGLKILKGKLYPSGAER